MQHLTPAVTLLACFACVSFGQSPEDSPRFEAVDVHAASKAPNAYVRTPPVHDGRYEIRNATMVDLIRIAYRFNAEKIAGGPNWLELDRFDVIAKEPSDTTPEMQRQMLQAVLRDRFHLVSHTDTRPIPAYALTTGRKVQLKEAAESHESGCKPQSAGAAPEGGARINMSMNGNATTLTLGPGMTIHYACRNMTMAEFAAGMRTMMGAMLGPNAIVDETGLKGKWDFDLRYSLNFMGPMPGGSSDRITFPDALEKQLGLKLEEKQIPTEVLVVDKVNRTPDPNPPGIAEILPPVPAATEFEVASLKLADPGSRMSRFQIQPGGRVMVEGMPLRFLIGRAFNTFNNDEIVGLPEVGSDRYDLIAKAPSAAGNIGPGDMDTIAPMILALLKDRFKLAYHTEERQVSAYSLVAAKPKLKKADPESRIYCRNTTPPLGTPPGSRFLKCQNATMALFAEHLQGAAPELNWPVTDATGLEGAYDLTLTWSMRFMGMMPPGLRGGDSNAAAGSAVPTASDPVEGYTVFEAIEKQLGLKLEKQKRSMPVIVIDHIDPKPSEN